MAQTIVRVPKPVDTFLVSFGVKPVNPGTLRDSDIRAVRMRGGADYKTRREIVEGRVAERIETAQEGRQLVALVRAAHRKEVVAAGPIFSMARSNHAAELRPQLDEARRVAADMLALVIGKHDGLQRTTLRDETA